MTRESTAFAVRWMLSLTIIGVLATALFWPHPTLPVVRDAVVIAAALLAMYLIWTTARGASTSRRVGLTLLAITLLNFVARMVASGRLGTAPFHDPFYYFASYRSMVAAGEIPASNIHDVAGLAAWPFLHLLHLAVTAATGVAEDSSFLWLVPLVSALVVPLSIWGIGRLITRNETTALWAALIGSLADNLVYYGSEYHQQGYALAGGLFVLWLWLKWVAKTPSAAGMFLLTIAMSGLVFGHRFSSLVVVLLLFGAGAAAILLRAFFVASPEARAKEQRGALWVAVAFGVAAIAYHVLAAIDFLQFGLEKMLEVAAGFSIETRGNVPEETPEGTAWHVVRNLSKYLLMLAGTAWVAWAVLRRRWTWGRAGVHLVALLIAIGGFIVVGIALGELATNRMLALYLAVASPFIAEAVYRAAEKGRAGRAAGSLLIVSLISLGFFNALPPAFYFDSSEPTPEYWNDNTLPGRPYPATADWLEAHAGQHVPKPGELPRDEPFILTSFETRGYLFHYGDFSYPSLRKLMAREMEQPDEEYVVFDAALPSAKWPARGAAYAVYDSGGPVVLRSESAEDLLRQG